jgi:hypothetical protein
MHSFQDLKTLAAQETPAERRRRMLPGAMYGLIIASAYGFVAAFVNQLWYPNVPVGVDWQNVLFTWLFLALWLGLGGWFINWFTQTEEGFIPSLVVMSATGIMASLFSLEGNLPTQFGRIFLLAVPVLVMSVLMTLILRWLGVHHAEYLEREPAVRRRGFILLITISLLLGVLGGFALTRWSQDVYSGVQDVHARLQRAANDPSKPGLMFPLEDLPHLEAHLGTPYSLYGRASSQSVVAVETIVNFADGYQIICASWIFPDKPASLSACAEGDKVSLKINP